MKRLALVIVVAVGTWAGAEEPDQAQMDFANGLFQRGLFKEAVEEYRAYLTQFPQGKYVSTALYRLGEAEYAGGNQSGALEAFDKLLGSPDLESAVQQQASARRGEVLYRLKRYDEARPVLEPLAAPELPPDVRARALYYLGKLHFDQNNPAEALNALKRLVDELPEHALAPYARFQVGFVYLALNDTQNAAIAFGEVAKSAPDAELRMESRFRAAEAYDKIGWYDAAAAAYEQLRQEFPDSVYAERAMYGHAWASYHAGKVENAAALAAEFLAKYTNSERTAGVKYLQANCQQQQKKYAEALELYRAIEAQFATSEFALRAKYKIAWAQYLNGNVQEAKTAIMEFLEKHKDSAWVGDASFLLGSILAAEGNFEDAYEEFRLVAEKYTASEFAPEALYKAGECLAQLGRTEEAAKVFENFAKAYPDNILAEQAILRSGDAQFFSTAFQQAVDKYNKILESGPEPGIEEETLYRLAITYHNMQKFDASAETFRKLLAKFPASSHVAEAHLRIGDFLLREAKDVVHAMEAYQASYDLNPKGPMAGRALKGLALARYETKDFDGAAEAFLRVMTEFPSVALNEGSYAWTGQYLFDQQKWDQAGQVFAALLAAVKDYPNPERVGFKIAECSEAAGKAEEAVKKYQAVVDQAPRTEVAVEALYRMAKLYEGKNEADKALALYEQAANANTGDTAARARFRLGELYEQKGDFSAAARSYMRIAILFLHEQLSPESLWRAGQCFEKGNSLDQAKRSYQELLSEFPNCEQANRAKERLAQLG